MTDWHLARLRRMEPHLGLGSADDWAGFVSDAERLVRDGWVAQALRLGWEPVEIFGVGQEYDGLAYWLFDREMKLLTDRGALTTYYEARAFYQRRDPSVLVMPWEWPE